MSRRHVIPSVARDLGGGLLLFSLLVLAACGYALVGRGVNLPEDVREVYIKPLDNRTPRSQVEQFLTRAIAEELVTRRRFAVVGNAEGADAELSGAVVGFSVTPVSFDDTGRATEYEISIVAQVAFKRIADEAVLWSNDRYVFRQSYPVDVSEAGFFDREDQAIEEAAERFAETMVSDLLEGF